MKIRLTEKQGRYLALGLLLLATTAIVVAIAWPTWRLHQHYDRHIEEYSDHLQRYRRIAGMRPSIEQAVGAVEARSARKFFLNSMSPTLAAAELQGLVTKTIETHQGKIISSQLQPVKETEKGSRRVPVALSVQMTSAMVPLQLILHAIESGEPYLFVDQLSVRAHHGRGYRPVPGVQPEFAVQMTVHGYMMPEGAKP